MSAFEDFGSATTPVARPKIPPGKVTASRLPPPALFQGPPSHDASNISLAPPAGATGGPSSPKSPLSGHGPSQRPQQAPRFSKISGSLRGPTVRAQQGEAKNENDRADALWAEMQNTLAEVELSASSGSHLFSAEHAKALEDLRTAQLALAQAWAKSESVEDSHHSEDKEADLSGTGTAGVQRSPSQREKATQSRNNSRDRNLEEQAEKDILLARKRREANEKYFQQVNSGVLDVVAKLEGVANAMRQVEKESKEIWSEAESSASVTESVTDATESPLTHR